MSDVKFTIFAAEDPWYSFTETGPCIATLPGSWSELSGNGQECAKTIAQDYFSNGDLWGEWFGDDDSAIVMVDILAPEANKGIYEVAMELNIKAYATPATDPRL